jgi:hypothetical protein
MRSNIHASLQQRSTGDTCNMRTQMQRVALYTMAMLLRASLSLKNHSTAFNIMCACVSCVCVCVCVCSIAHSVCMYPCVCVRVYVMKAVVCTRVYVWVCMSGRLLHARRISLVLKLCQYLKPVHEREMIVF